MVAICVNVCHTWQFFVNITKLNVVTFNLVIFMKGGWAGRGEDPSRAVSTEGPLTEEDRICIAGCSANDI